jgi:hypothetical protein
VHGPKPQFPTPLPSIPGLVKILFTSKPVANQTLYGVPLSERLNFCDVLENAPNPVTTRWGKTSRFLWEVVGARGADTAWEPERVLRALGAPSCGVSAT